MAKYAQALNLRGHKLATRPLEEHTFSGSDFLCDKCGRPRALHADTGFRPSSAPDRITNDPAASYRNRRRDE